MNRCAVVIAGVVLMQGGWVDAAPGDCPEDTTPTLFAVFGSPVLCTSDRGSCLTIGRAKSADRAVAHPARPETHLRDDHGRMQACAGPECRNLGPVATAAVRESLTHKARPTIAPDLAVLVTYGASLDESNSALPPTVSQVISIADDRALPLKPPASARGGAIPSLMGVKLLGGALIATWMSCASEDCVRSTVVGPDGANLGKELPYSVGVALDDHRIALAGNGGEVIVLDRTTARVVGRAKFDPAGKRADALDVLGIVALSPDEVAILWDNHDLRLVRVKIGKQLQVGAQRKLPRCT